MTPNQNPRFVAGDKPKRRRRVNPMSQTQRQPWKVDGCSKRTFFRRKAAKRAANGEPPAQRFGRTKQAEASS
jgi:hypothetical protein